MNLGSRRVRLKAVWLLLVPYLVFARPTPGHLAVGGGLALLGALVRAWAAGHIRKERELAVTGPYAHTRNPLYVGSFAIGLGVAVAGGRWIFVVLFVAFFLLVYRSTMRHEEEVLEEEFGEAYRRYRRRVPALVPRVTPYRAEALAGREEAATAAAPREDARMGARSGRFSVRRYFRNREWEAALGIVAGFAFLVAKMIWMA